MSVRRRQITSQDIVRWNDLDQVVKTLKYRGLSEADEREEISEELEDNQRDVLHGAETRFLQLANNYFIAVIEAEEGKSPDDYRTALSPRLRSALVVEDYNQFTFITRKRSLGPKGRTTYQRYSFTREQFTNDGKIYSTLDKLNDLEEGDPTSIQNLYDTREVVKEFYREFESYRTKLVKNAYVEDAEKPGEAKERYVQVILNRLIFLHFIQEKELLDDDPQYLKRKHKLAEASGEGTYKTFYEPLFFKVLAEEGDEYDDDDEIDVSFLAEDELPYLNGGLFSKAPVEIQNPSIRLAPTIDKEDQLYREVLDFLDSWNWHIDEHQDIVEPKNLSPEILGHIFEQTVNQKEMGAYYTPEAITNHMAQKAIYPRLLEKLNEELDDRTYESLERAIELGSHVGVLYEDVLLETKVLDPAVGSGAFLLAAENALLDIYLECIDALRRDYDEDDAPTEIISNIVSRSPAEDELEAKRAIIQNNLYGVDIDSGAVEICKLRLWLSTVAHIESDPNEVQPLPNIEFNIRPGNSLIGFIGTTEWTPDGNETLGNYSAGSVDDRVDEIAGLIKNQEEAAGHEAAQLRQEVEDKMDEHRPDLNEKVLEEFERAGLEDATIEEVENHNPFHWVIEFAKVYREGWFDVVIGNPPWDRIRATKDDFYSDYIESFRTLMPNEQKEQIQSLTNENPEIEDEFSHFRDSKQRLAKYFHKSNDYELQSPEVDGRKRTTENDLSALFLERIYKLADEDTYISQLLPGNIFTGLATKDLRDQMMDKKTTKSIIGFKNKGIFSNIDSRYKFGIAIFKNSGETESLKGIFGQPNLKILHEIREGDDSRLLNIPKQVLADYSPIAGTFPIVETQEQVDVINKIVQHPQAAERDNGSWYANPYRELDRTQDKDRFLEVEEDGDYPVLGGSNVYLFSWDNSIYDIEGPKFWSVDDGSDKSAKQRIREKSVRSLKSGLYDLVKNSAEVRERYGVTASGSKKSTVNELLEESRDKPLTEDDVLLDCSEYRIVYRDVAQPTDERTMIATVIPPGYVCHNKLHTVRPFEVNPEIDDLTDDSLHSVYKRIFTTDEQLFAAVGLLNSIPFDYLMRTKVDKSVVMYKFRESQVPHLTEKDDWFEEIWKPAAKLNCYGSEFRPMRERLGGLEAIDVEDREGRRDQQAKLDAAAFHAYGFDQSEVEFILDDFHRVGSPRIMDEDYFELVRKHCEDLA